MTDKDKARLEELEAKEYLVEDEDVIDYYRLSCEKLEEENENLKETIKILTCTNDSAIIQNLKAENQELAETLELYNEKFAGHERVKTDLIKENQELKKGKRQLLHDGITLANEVIKLKKTIEILKRYVGVGLGLKGYIYSLGRSMDLTEEEYKLLKEVLE